MDTWFVTVQDLYKTMHCFEYLLLYSCGNNCVFYNFLIIIMFYSLQISQIRKTKEEKLGNQLNELQRAGYWLHGLYLNKL